MIEQQKYCVRFGQIAVESGFLSSEQLQQALHEQVDDNLVGRPHRVLGAICFAHSWITPAQIDMVLNILFKNNRQKQPEVVLQVVTGPDSRSNFRAQR